MKIVATLALALLVTACGSGSVSYGKKGYIVCETNFCNDDRSVPAPPPAPEPVVEAKPEAPAEAPKP
jgi:hypothetical protein